jgi:dihydrodipicolinate synthase/N-acetylneuraminate lyase
MMDQQLRGVLPVIQTPFDAADRIDFDTLTYEVGWALDQGVDGLTIGMVSEYLRLTDDERIAIGRATVEAARGTPVIMSVGAESTAAACGLAARAQDAGAAALMAIPPISVTALESEIARYYEALLAVVDLPIIVQDASGYVGASLSIDMQVSLLERFGPRVMFKPEADPIGPRLTALRDASNGEAMVFEGTGGIALIDSFRRGIVGTMPAVDCCWALVALWSALSSGDDQAAYAIHGPLASLVSLQTSLDTFVAIEKHLLVRQGVFESDRARGPVGFVLDPETRDEVDRLFDRLAEAAQTNAPRHAPAEQT